MTRDIIGQIAGEIWNNLVNEAKPVSLTTLAKNIGRKKEEVVYGIGWLACEDKLNIDEKGKVSLK